MSVGRKLALLICPPLLALSLIHLAGPLFKREIGAIQIRTLNAFMPKDLKPLLDTHRDDKSASRLAQYYKLIILIMPERDEAYAVLGVISARANQDAKAASYFRKAKQLNPQFFWHGFNLGLIEARLGHAERSIQSFKEVLNFPPDSTLNYFASSKILLDIYRESSLPLQALPQGLYEGYRQGYWVLASLLLRQGGYNDLLQYSMKAIELNFDQKGEFFYYAGRAAYETGDFKRAALLLKASLDRNGNNAEAMRYLAMSLGKLGENGAAAAILAQADLMKQSGQVLEDPLKQSPRIF